VLLRGIDAKRLVKTVPQQFAGGPRGFHRRVEIVGHEGRVLSTVQLLNLSTQKKPGGENEFSSRVEVIGWNYEKAP
jgi:hypothetical protein